MSSVVVVTGSAGLIGSESVRHFAGLGMDVVGIDNDMRGYFFGSDGSTKWNLDRLRSEVGDRYTHHDLDIRDRDGLAALFQKLGRNVALVIHAAAQPSHDLAAKRPFDDFDLDNAVCFRRRLYLGPANDNRYGPLLAQDAGNIPNVVEVEGEPFKEVWPKQRRSIARFHQVGS